jgi:hypothetical protein
VEARPPVLIEKAVGLLLPPACREEILGDLHERYRSLRQYLFDAARIIPLAVKGQIRRTFDRLLLAMIGFALYLVFRPRRPVGLGDVLSLAIPMGIALLAFALCDAYARPKAESRETEDVEAAFDADLGRAVLSAALAMAAAVLADRGLAMLGAPDAWHGLDGSDVAGGFLLTLPIRATWGWLFREGGYRRLVMGSVGDAETVHGDRRALLERRRDILRRSWLWYLTLPASGASLAWRRPSASIRQRWRR